MCCVIIAAKLLIIPRKRKDSFSTKTAFGYLFLRKAGNHDKAQKRAFLTCPKSQYSCGFAAIFSDLFFRISSICPKLMKLNLLKMSFMGVSGE